MITDRIGLHLVLLPLLNGKTLYHWESAGKLTLVRMHVVPNWLKSRGIFKVRENRTKQIKRRLSLARNRKKKQCSDWLGKWNT